MTKRNLLAVHRHSVLMLLIAIALTLFACSSDNDSSPKTYTAYNITFADIEYWVGSGTNEAIMIVQWNEGGTTSALAWGYKWPVGETRTGYDMINDIAKEDERFFYIKFNSNNDTAQYGYAIGGIGYSPEGRPIILDSTLSNNCTNTIEMSDSNSINTNGYDFDNWKVCSPTDARWESGWYSGYWSYYTTDNISNGFEYSSVGASSRDLVDGSVDLWDFISFSSSFDCDSTCDIRNYITDIEPVNRP